MNEIIVVPFIFFSAARAAFEKVLKKKRNEKLIMPCATMKISFFPTQLHMPKIFFSERVRDII